jgi:hypothetical protein
MDAKQRPTADGPAVAKAMAGKLQIYADNVIMSEAGSWVHSAAFLRAYSAAFLGHAL